MGCLQVGSLWAVEVPEHREADTRKAILMLTMAIMQAKLTRQDTAKQGTGLCGSCGQF